MNTGFLFSLNFRHYYYSFLIGVYLFRSSVLVDHVDVYLRFHIIRLATHINVKRRLVNENVTKIAVPKRWFLSQIANVRERAI